MEAIKYSPKELHLRCYSGYEKRESISVILWHVEASINSLKVLKNYLWRSSYLTTFVKRWDSFRATFWTNLFSRRYEHVKGFTEIHSRTPTLSSTLFCDNFVKLSYFCDTSLWDCCLSETHKTIICPLSIIKKTYKAMRTLL